ncbi:hypothetical protein FACS1894178_8140 [Bacteroidia bacterium]|nr:hypothetical protein FACS1894178_8140 [Bacteroidia bacterium]
MAKSGDRGLVKFDKSKNKVVRQNYNTSTSPKDGAKNTNYAVYDLEQDGDTIYLATTRGLFSIDIKSDRLKEIRRKDTHHVIYKLLLNCDKKYLYYSETYKHESKVSIYDIENEKHYPLEYIHDRSHFFSKGTKDSVYCIHSDNTLCLFHDIISHNEKKLEKKWKKGENLFAYFRDANKEYFLTNQRFFSKDKKIHINLPDGIQSRHKNHIIDDSSHFIIASGKYIYKIAKNSDKIPKDTLTRTLFTDSNTNTDTNGDFKPIAEHFSIDTVAAKYRYSERENVSDTFQPEIQILTNTLYDDKLLYFITTDNTLYQYDDSKEKDKVKRITKLQLKDASSFIGLRASEKHLWLLTEKFLYQIEKITGTFAYINTYSYKNIRQDLTSIYYDKAKNILYLGGRKNLFYLKNVDKTIIAQDKDSLFTKVANPASIHSDLYITDFCKRNDTIFLGTLNQGLFCLSEKKTDDNVKILASDTISQKDTIITHRGEYNIKSQNTDSMGRDTIIFATPKFGDKDTTGNIFLLTMTEDAIQTTKGLYKQQTNGEWDLVVPIDSTKESHNIIRILPDTNICIGYRGIYVNGTWQHLEVWTNPKAICNSGTYVFLGGNLGLYKYDKVHDRIEQIKIIDNSDKCLKHIRTWLQNLTGWCLLNSSEKTDYSLIRWFISEIGIINFIVKLFLLVGTIWILSFCYRKHVKYRKCKKNCRAGTKCTKIGIKEETFTYFGRKLFVSKYYDYINREDENHYNKWKNHHPYNQFTSYEEYCSNAELERDRRKEQKNGFRDEFLAKRICFKIRTLYLYLSWCFGIYIVSIFIYMLQQIFPFPQNGFWSVFGEVLPVALDSTTSVLLVVSYFNLQYTHNDIQHKPFANWVTIIFSMLCVILIGLQILSITAFKETANENIITFLISSITSLIAALALSLFVSRMYVIHALKRSKVGLFISIFWVLICASANIALCFSEGVFLISNLTAYKDWLHLIVSLGMGALYFVLYHFLQDKNLKMFFMNEINKTKTFGEEHLGIAELHLLMRQKTREDVLLEAKNEDLEELTQMNENQKKLEILKIIKK